MVTAKYIVYIVQNTKVVHGPRIYTEQKQHFTSQQLFKVVTSRQILFSAFSLRPLSHEDLSP